MAEGSRFKMVFRGLDPVQVNQALDRMETEYEQMKQTLQQRIRELTGQRDQLQNEISTLEKVLTVPEMAPRFIELAEARIARTEAFFKSAAEKDRENITREFHARSIANDVKQQQIEESIRQCREQFQGMMNGLNSMIRGAAQKPPQTVRPNLVVVETKKEADSMGAGSAVIDTALASEDLSPEILRHQYIFGKKAGRDLFLEDGTLLIRQGEAVRPDIAKAAEDAGKLNELVRYLQTMDLRELS